MFPAFFELLLSLLFSLTLLLIEKFNKSDPLLTRVFVAPCKVIRIAESVKLFSNGIRNLGLWNLELGCRILNPAIDWNESGIQILLTKNPVQEPIRSCPDPVPGIRNPQLGIQSPSSTDKDWNPVPGIRNPQRGIENPRLSWVTLHRAISVSLLMYVLVLGGFRSFLIQ